MKMIALTALCILLCIGAAAGASTIDTFLADFFPGYNTSQKCSRPFSHILVFGKEGCLLGAGFFSKDVVNDIEGFKGPLNLFIGITASGDISGVAVVSHHETPAYARKAFSKELLGQFAGKKTTDPFVAGRDIQAVSGATVSSVALIDTIRATVHEAYPRIFKDGICLSDTHSAVQRKKQ